MYTHEWEEREARPTAPVKPVVLPQMNKSLYPLMIEYLRGRDLSYVIASENGWYPTIDRYRWPRVVIPASSLKNSWPYYQARLIVDAPEDVKRYMSPSAPRGDALAIVFPNKCTMGSIIVEGPMDALAAAGMGYVGIGLMGNTPNQAVLDHIEEIVKTYGTCFVIPDRDAFQEGVEITAELWTRGIKCTLKRISGGKDLAKLSPKQRADLILS